MNDENEVGHQGDESAATDPGEAQDKSDALEIETFINDRDREPPRWGELFGVFCLIALCDLTIYRGEGFAGYALLFFVSPLFIVVEFEWTLPGTGIVDYLGNVGGSVNQNGVVRIDSSGSGRFRVDRRIGHVDCRNDSLRS
jgi:hypothetical protein